MANFRRLLVAAIGAFSLLGATGVSVAASEGHRLIEFDSMTGVSAAEAAAGLANDRGILPGGKPWVIESGRGKVDRNGNVDVRVRGLVIPVAPFNGTNPIHFFRATVSCLGADGKAVNVSTDQFPASTEGDAKIKGHVTLPQVCNDPLVFVVSPSFAWFAMSNVEDDD